MKKFLIVILLATTLLPLLANPAYSSTIKVFAPSTYAPGTPIGAVTAFDPILWGYSPSSGGTYLVPSTGYTFLAPSSNFGSAVSWFNTPWTHYAGANAFTQVGSVTSDTWLNYSIAGPVGTGGVIATIVVTEYNPNTGLIQWWTKTESDSVPGHRNKTFDLGVIPSDLSMSSGINPPQPFYWTAGCWYQTEVVLQAVTSGAGATVFASGKFDDILYIGYTYSPGDDWIISQPTPQMLSLSPPIGPVGTNVAVNGTGFQPSENVTLFWDSLPVNQTLTDGSGMFMASFNVPPSTHGRHVIKANGTGANDTATSFFDVFVEVAPLSGDVNGDGKVDGEDLVLVARQFGHFDPNMDPPVTVQQAAMGLSAVALIGAVNLGGSRRREKNTAERA